jgi:hypothetical protein
MAFRRKFMPSAEEIYCRQADIWQHDEKQHYGLRNIGEFVGPSGCRYVRRDIQFSLYMEQVSQPA